MQPFYPKLQMESYIGSTNSRRMFGWKKTKQKPHRAPVDKYGSVNSLCLSYSSYSLYGTASIRAYPWENCVDFQEPIYEDVSVGGDNCTCDSPIYAELYAHKKKRTDERRAQKKLYKALENKDPFSSVASRKSILECDVTAYDLVKNYFKSKDPHLDSDLDDDLSDNAVEEERTAVTSPPSSTISEGESGIYSSIRLAGYGIRVGTSSDGTSSTQCSIASDDGIYSLPEPDYDDSDEDLNRFKDLKISSSPLMVKKHDSGRLPHSVETSVSNKKYSDSSAKMAASVKVYPIPNRINMNKTSSIQSVNKTSSQNNNTMTVAVRIRNAQKPLSEVKSILKKTENNGQEVYVNHLNFPIVQEYKDMRKKKHVHFKSSRESLQCIDSSEDSVTEVDPSDATKNDNMLFRVDSNGFQTVEDFLQKSNNVPSVQSKCRVSFSEFCDLRNQIIVTQSSDKLGNSNDSHTFTKPNKETVTNVCFKNHSSVCCVSSSGTSQANKDCVNDTKEKNIICSADIKVSNSPVTVIKSLPTVPLNASSHNTKEKSVVCIQNSTNSASSKNTNLSPAITIDVRGISSETQISRTEITPTSTSEAKMVNLVKINGNKIDRGEKKVRTTCLGTLQHSNALLQISSSELQKNANFNTSQNDHLAKVNKILTVQNETSSLQNENKDSPKTCQSLESSNESYVSGNNTPSMDSSAQVEEHCTSEKPSLEDSTQANDLVESSNSSDKVVAEELNKGQLSTAEEAYPHPSMKANETTIKETESKEQNSSAANNGKDSSNEEFSHKETEEQLASTKNDSDVTSAKTSDINSSESFHHKSFFEGASKTEILNYLEDAKSRGLDYLSEDTVEMTSNDLIGSQNCTSSIEKFPEEILLQEINEIQSSQDLADDIDCSSTNADVERNDSGVGTETSKPSKLRRLVSPGTEELLCADCDLQIESLMGKQWEPHSCPLLCKKCSNKRSERKETIAEIVDTEFKYGRDLKVIKEEFYCPMEVAGLLTKVQLRSVFVNLDELIRVNGKFAEKLKDALDIAVEQGDEDYTTVNIGRLFLESSSMLHAFETYCVRQASASMLLASLEKEKELLRIFLRVSQMENTLLRRMNLPAFLMVPVQRVTKYPLLLNRLYKVTPYHHQDREALKEAQQKIELHLEHINQQTKGSGCTRIWRRFSNISVAAHRRITNGLDIGNIKLRKMALEVLRWNREEVRFVMAGKLFYAQASDYPWMKKNRKAKFTVVHALLATLGKPNSNYRPDLASENTVLFPKNTGIRDATLLLMKEKNGRFVPIREPLHLGNCVISTDSPNGEVFEVQEYSTKESFLFKAETISDTKEWLKQLRYHAKDLGAWRKRRNALANIMINGMTRS